MKPVELFVSPEIAVNREMLLPEIAKKSGIAVSEIVDFYIVKRSVDARRKPVKIRLLIDIVTDPNQIPSSPFQLIYNQVHHSPPVIIVGAGPAGLFAAIKLIELNYKPIIIERGKTVRERGRDVAAINTLGIVNPESNYCFGEGGAGTFSDGKLYTRSTRRGNINRILDLFIAFGALPEIKIDAHPHIGTNKLSKIIATIRKYIVDAGGEILLTTKVVDLLITSPKIKGVKTSDGTSIKAEAVILATGHSARDIFTLLHNKKLQLEAKPFALGVRIEHPQALIDSIQYHCETRSTFLPPARYNLVTQVEGRGVYSFCMCPGGNIAPCATNPDEVVTNGWSPAKRDSPYANAGLVVEVKREDLKEYAQFGPLAAMYFQKHIEHQAFLAGGGNQVAPAQRLRDFMGSKLSSSLPKCSYKPGLNSVNLKEVLPALIADRLKAGLNYFGKRMPAYLTNEAVLVAVESRTSSPVRIPRNPDTLQHLQIPGLFPCGEGAGYAGGIVSSALDGENCAEAAGRYLEGIEVR
ncbi:MAG: FAD-binding protein [Pseudomonadota bacterium]